MLSGLSPRQRTPRDRNIVVQHNATSPTAGGKYQSLDPVEIQATIARLMARIRERFPDSGLTEVCGHLHGIGANAAARSVKMVEPIFWIRALTIFLVVVLCALCVDLPFLFRPSNDSLNIVEFIAFLEPSMNILVLLGAAIYYLVTLEQRYKRTRALKAIHELRAVAHIIDMHQLTKDPDTMKEPGRDTPSSPKRTLTRFELLRYLDYCSELLSLTGKIAALYTQHFDDPVAIASVNEVETLCTGLSRKIWQKIMILHEVRC